MQDIQMTFNLFCIIHKVNKEEKKLLIEYLALMRYRKTLLMILR